MDTIKVNYNGAWVNASHYASFAEGEAVKRLADDNVETDAANAKKLHGLCVKAVAESKKAEKN